MHSSRGDGQLTARASRVLIAPDKFKGSLTAHEVASAIAAGIADELPGIEADLCPVADGGDGTLDAAVSAGFRRVHQQVEGPTGEPVLASYGERDGVALVELADAAGLRRLAGKRLAPLTASTYGAGQLVDAAIRAGNQTIVLAIGGSASTDGGAGLVQALGADLLDGRGQPLKRGGGALAGIDRIGLERLRTRLHGIKFILASDVTSPLLGPTGAAAVYGPQKGATATDIDALERGLTRWASVVTDATKIEAAGYPGAGAAGGVGFGAITLLGATLVPGADLILDMINFGGRLSQSALVITGEGSLDEQTLLGKAPARVGTAAKKAHIPAVAAVGICTLSQDTLTGIGIHRVYTLQALEPDLANSITNAARLLRITGTQIAETELETAAQGISGNLLNSALPGEAEEPGR